MFNSARQLTITDFSSKVDFVLPCDKNNYAMLFNTCMYYK